MIDTILGLSTPQLVIVGFLVAVTVAATLLISEPGPVTATTVTQRYGTLALIPIAVLGVAVGVIFAPMITALAAVVVVLLGVWKHDKVRNGYRRLNVRATWPSIARSCGLANTNDRRSATWPGGAIVNNLSSNRVEYLPTISWGRRIGPDTVVWRLIPARGSTLREIAEQGPALAAAMKAAQVSVHQDFPYQGRLEVRWG